MRDNRNRPILGVEVWPDLSPETVNRWMDWLVRQGFGGLAVVGGSPEPIDCVEDWLPGYMRSVEYVVNAAKARDAEVWILDEWGYPSGTACGMVLREPAFRAKKLHIRADVWLEPGQTFEQPLPERFVAARALPADRFVFYHPVGVGEAIRAKNRRLVYHAKERTRVVVVTWEYVSFVTHVMRPDDGDISLGTTDLLDPAAVRRYLDCMHELYVPHIGAEFGRTVKGFFYVDRELCYDFPYSPGLPAYFEQMHGYPLADILPELMAYLPAETGVTGGGDAFPRLRRMFDDYTRAWTGLLAESFYGQLESWCHDHRLLTIGHQDLDNQLATLCTVSGDFYKNSARSDHPGVDVIWDHIAPGRFEDFPRFAGSVKRTLHKSGALSETFAEMGPCMYPDRMRWIMEHQLLRGITQFVFLAVNMDQGQTGADSTAREKPVENEPVPVVDVAGDISLYSPGSLVSAESVSADVPAPDDGSAPPQAAPKPFLPSPFRMDDRLGGLFGRDLYDRVARTAALLDEGRPGAEVAVYIPMSDIAFETRQANPHRYNNRPFVSDRVEALARRLCYQPVDFDYAWEDGLAGLYERGIRLLLLSGVRSLPDRVLPALTEFHAQGGEIVALERPCAAPDGLIRFEPNPAHTLDALSSGVRLNAPNPRVSLTTRDTEQGRVWFLLNETEAYVDGFIAFEAKGVECLESSSGNWEPFATFYERPCTFAPRELKVFREAPVANFSEQEDYKFSLAGWRLICPDGADWELTVDAPVNAAFYANPDRYDPLLKSWDTLGYANYSGPMTYEARFSWPGGRCEIDLGIVQVAAVVELDGQTIRLPFSPYRFRIDLSAGEHVIRVIVHNTEANALYAGEDEGRHRFGGAYWELYQFERAYAESGLRGPVTVRALL